VRLPQVPETGAHQVEARAPETVGGRVSTDKYILRDDGTIVQERDFLTWAHWFETFDRHIALDLLPEGIKVSTVFLGLDHNFGLTGPPILFETMIFGGEHHEYQERYATRDEAFKGHKKALALAKGELETA
jgi:hypothetical protein